MSTGPTLAGETSPCTLLSLFLIWVVRQMIITEIQKKGTEITQFGKQPKCATGKYIVPTEFCCQSKFAPKLGHRWKVFEHSSSGNNREYRVSRRALLLAKKCGHHQSFESPVLGEVVTNVDREYCCQRKFIDRRGSKRLDLFSFLQSDVKRRL